MLPEKLQRFLNELASLDDPDLRADYLIETADRFRDVPEAVATRPFDEQHRVPACESEAFVWAADHPEGRGPQFYFAVENPQGISAKATAVILDENLSGITVEEIERVDEDIIYDIFGRNISMGKGMGLTSMVRMTVYLAQQWQKQREPKS